MGGVVGNADAHAATHYPACMPSRPRLFRKERPVELGRGGRHADRQVDRAPARQDLVDVLVLPRGVQALWEVGVGLWGGCGHVGNTRRGRGSYAAEPGGACARAAPAGRARPDGRVAISAPWRGTGTPLDPESLVPGEIGARAPPPRRAAANPDTPGGSVTGRGEGRAAQPGLYGAI